MKQNADFFLVGSLLCPVFCGGCFVFVMFEISEYNGKSLMAGQHEQLCKVMQWQDTYFELTSFIRKSCCAGTCLQLLPSVSSLFAHLDSFFSQSSILYLHGLIWLEEEGCHQGWELAHQAERTQKEKQSHITRSL